MNIVLIYSVSVVAAVLFMVVFHISVCCVQKVIGGEERSSYKDLGSDAKRKVMVVVDFQKDFYDSKDGTLYVPGAEDCVEPICEAIRKEKFDTVILTLDWHRFGDKSFKENGGPWPVHCLRYSDGAGIHSEIMRAVKDSGSRCEFFIKGNCETHEEYGAFEVSESFGGHAILRNFLCDSQVTLNHVDETDVFVCGLAGDYCVKKTFQNLKELGFHNVSLFEEGIAYITPPSEGADEEK